MKSVAALISGGVDSSVVVHLLVEQGIRPHLFYIAIGPDVDFSGYDCKMEEDIDISRSVAMKYNLPFDIVDCHSDYWEKVMAYHIDSLRKGFTPNPDVLCNRLIKFGSFEDKAGKDFDIIATGHYASKEVDADGRHWLCTAIDPVKDQTYFLSGITYPQLRKSLFPLGKYMKTEIRAIASEAGLLSSTRKDSTGICFIGRNQYDDFIASMLGEKNGDIIDSDTGKKLGQHKGHWFHTIGQRKGLGLAGGPWFVINKDIEENIIWVARGYEPEKVYKNKIHIQGFSFMTSDPWIENSTHRIKFKIRHSPVFLEGVLYREDDITVIESRTPVHGVAAGQYAVVYDENANKLIGSGMIVAPVNK